MSELAAIDWRAVLLVIGLAYAPGIFWLWYFYRKDLEPEPLHQIRNCFLAGMAVCIPAAILETPAKIWGTVFLVSVAGPILEECFKFGACYLIAYRRKEFNEPMDGVVYAVAVALGFASLENVFYLYEAQREGLGPLSTLTLIRAFFTVPGHALFAIMWGYALGRAKFTDHATGRRLILAGLGLAIVAHGLFNLMSLVTPFWAIGMMVFIPVAWGLANRKIAEAVEISPHGARKEFKAKIAAFKASLARDANSGRWFDNRFVVAVLLFFVFFPAGFYALYRNTTFSRPEKVTYLALWIFCVSVFSAGIQ